MGPACSPTEAAGGQLTVGTLQLQPSIGMTVTTAAAVARAPVLSGLHVESAWILPQPKDFVGLDPPHSTFLV